MARIAGVDLPRNKRIDVALTYIYGIGRGSASKILRASLLDSSKKVYELTEDEINRIRKEIERNYVVEGDLRTRISMNIKRLIDIGCYRGIRHRMGLPVRGQRTRTNARTRKGRKKVPVGGLKKKLAKK